MMHKQNSVLCLVIMAVLLSWACTALAVAVDSILPFEDSASHLWGYKDARGTVLIAPCYSVAQDFSPEGIAAVADQSGWMYIDTKGKVLIRPFILDNGPDPFQQGLARFRDKGKIGFFDQKGKVIIDPKFDFALPFSDGLAAFCQGCKEQQEDEHHSVVGGKWGFIDTTGQIVIAPQYEKADPFEQGKAKVMLNGQPLTIKKQGELIQ